MLPLSKSIEGYCWAERMTYSEYLEQNGHSLVIGPRLDEEAFTSLMDVLEKFYNRSCAAL